MSAPVSVTLTGLELRDLLAPVLPLAGKDGMLPILTTVQLSVDDGHLVAAATDRFRLGMSRHKLENDTGQDFAALVYVRDLKRILALYKPTRSSDPELRLTVRASEGLLEVTNLGAFDGLVDATLVFPVHEGTFPNVRKLLVDVMQLEPDSTPRAFNPAFLAAFAAAPRTANEPLVLRQADPKKPLVVTCGEHFIGALMPVRNYEHDLTEQQQGALLSWRELLLPKAVSA